MCSPATRVLALSQSATPNRCYTMLNQESPEFIRFINPSDYRVAREACGACHLPEIQEAERSLMATGGDVLGRRGVQQRHPAL